ncbi:MAG: hypothetical protein GX640_03935 [Fibrobacter sp.]|nr:hypothetical protein [Fibrobacter sp.]
MLVLLYVDAIANLATGYSESCYYTVLPGDRGKSLCIITPQELNNAAVKGNKIPFSYGISSLLVQYNLVAGATGIEGEIIPEYNNYGYVTGNTYKYYVKDHLGPTRAVMMIRLYLMRRQNTHLPNCDSWLRFILMHPQYTRNLVERETTGSRFSLKHLP